MSIDDYYWATDREICNYIIGHRQLQWERSEDVWNLGRHVIHALIAPYMPKNDKTKPSDLIRLHMDGEPEQIDPYDAQRIREWSDLMDSIPFSDPREYTYN